MLDSSCSICIEVTNTAEKICPPNSFHDQSYNHHVRDPIRPSFETAHLDPQFRQTRQYDHPRAIDTLDSIFPIPNTTWDISNSNTIWEAPAAYPTLEQTGSQPSGIAPVLDPTLNWMQSEDIALGAHTNMDHNQPTGNSLGDLQWDGAHWADFIDPALASMTQQNSALLLQGRYPGHDNAPHEHVNEHGLAPTSVAETTCALQNGKSNIAAHAALTVAVTAPRGNHTIRGRHNNTQASDSSLTVDLKMEVPLSTMNENLGGREWQHEVTDIEAYVTRSTETRLSEVGTGKQPGKIRRPQNSFMLYRKAYQKRAMEWCKGATSQTASMVAAKSWAIETEDVKLQFKKWAGIEQDQHLIAFPGYKYRPLRKNGPVNSRLKAVGHVDKGESYKQTSAVTRCTRENQCFPMPNTQSHPRSLRYNTLVDPNAYDRWLFNTPWQPDFENLGGIEEPKVEAPINNNTRGQRCAQRAKLFASKRKANNSDEESDDDEYTQAHQFNRSRTPQPDMNLQFSKKRKMEVVEDSEES